MFKLKPFFDYLGLCFWLLCLGYLFFHLPAYRLLISIVVGLSYSIWGIFIHYRDRELYYQIILEYLGFGLLATTILIFISLRA